MPCHIDVVEIRKRVGRWFLNVIGEIMSIKVAILASNPTSYWPLDDLVGSRCHDEASLHDASVPAQGVSLGVIPFGECKLLISMGNWEAI
jgi:hypothetical protein